MMPAGKKTIRPTLGMLLRRPYRCIQEEFYADLAHSGHAEVTPAHSAVFRNVGPDGSRISDMAQEAGMAKQSMGYLVETLQRLGYVDLRKDPTDGRAKLVYLTPDGEEVVASLNRLSRKLERRIAREKSVEWLANLRDKLEELDRLLSS